jgi:hypothetical protein
VLKRGKKNICETLQQGFLKMQKFTLFSKLSKSAKIIPEMGNRKKIKEIYIFYISIHDHKNWLIHTLLE